MALMESALSKDGSVILLDRANVQKVLAEHNLALSGFLSTDDALKAGQLLQCGIFAELHYEKATNNIPEVISIVAFDAITGVRLCDETLATADSPKEFATLATEVLTKGIGKRQREEGTPACLTISLLSVRNVDLPSRMSGIVDCLGALVARQILRSPDVAVLERNRLEYVNQESGLTGDRRDRLLASAILLDLDISARGDTVRVRASMNDMTGKEIGAVTVERKADELGQLSKDVVNDVLKHLRLSPVKESTIHGSSVGFMPTPQMEARRFYQEAVFYRGHHEYIRSLPPMEAAHALDPANRQYLRELSLLLFDRAFLFLRPASDPEANVNYPYRLEVKTEALEHSLEIASRSLDYRLTLLKEVMADPQVADKLYYAVNEIIGQRGLDPYFQEATSAVRGNHSETTRFLLAEAQEKALRCILDYSRAVEREAAVKDPHSLDFDSMWGLGFIGRLRLYCGNANAADCFPSIIGIAEDWLSLLEQYGYPVPIRIIYPSPMDPGRTIIEALNAAASLGPTPISESAYKALYTFFQQMENHPFPDIQIHGAYGRRWAESLRRSLSEDEKMTSINAFFNEAKKKISSLPPDVPDIQLLNCYSAVMDYIRPVKYETRRRISVELFWVMKDRNELFGYVAERTLCDNEGFPAHRKEALELTEATLSILSNPVCRVVGGTDRGNIKNEFENIRYNLLLADPSLTKKAETPWTQEKLLFQVEKGETGIRRILCPTVHEGYIYFAGLGVDAKTGKHYVQL
ncbi:MAG: hypothetical protein L6437_15375, partial [Kiritimatiellae bacterium]|nr:hypothetical protein [Kiritimatiellia bacterium]